MTRLSASQHSLKYLYEGTGNVFVSKPQMLADCVAGPLRFLLLNTTDFGAWANLPRGSQLSVYITGLTEEIQAPIGRFTNNGIDNGLQVGGLPDDAQEAIVEIRFNHSIDR